MQTSISNNTAVFQHAQHNTAFSPHKNVQHPETQHTNLESKEKPILEVARPNMAGKITEIILQDEDQYNFQLLMPLLAQLSKNDRWFAWIAPPKKMPKSWLVEAGIDINKIIVLQPDENHSALELATKALETGTCHAVISWPDRLDNSEFETLQTAAIDGQSHAILIRPR